ncbi:MAG: alanine racemase domain protein [Candidatus Saganbacteria bacterium]|uniref:Pyridoxal phosphate homeostasis protein n=1 Tax=Candidatus Saganbacteria bacterium TaxID=2575572 RepID=A0A833L0N7_UNCSA|nr:MAG: alanine racemase domain protein [Candidatus Saganbacteria bacterium]
MTISQNIAKVREKAGLARIIAVTKNVEIPKIFEAIEAGITDVGENKVQEAAGKYDAIKSKYPQIKWHLIGHLQTNKVKAALKIFDVIQSVDSIGLATEINKRAEKEIEIFIEVNTSQETSKFGIKPELTVDLVKEISKLSNLRITGLMTMGPLTDDAEKIKASFKKLRELRDNLQLSGYVEIKHLSMGMSDDYSFAIEEGSDIIRVGRAIFTTEA